MTELKDVTVVIDIKKPTPKIGFGKPLVVGTSAAGADYKEYKSLDAVKADFTANSEIVKAATALFDQGDNSPEAIGVILKKTDGETWEELLQKALSKDWYFLVSTSSTLETITEIADIIEPLDSRQFFASSSSKDDLAVIKAKGYKCTTIFYHTTTDNYPEAAWIGATGSLDVGTVTWKFRTLNGIEPLELSAAELDEIHSLGANTYVTKAGDNVTSEGKTVAGEYIDVIHAKHYTVFSIEYEVQKLFNTSDKIGYDNTGIAQIESAVRTVLKRCLNQGIIARDEDGVGLYSTTFLTRSQVDPNDRANRVYNGGKFEFELLGAIHTAKISGVVTY